MARQRRGTGPLTAAQIALIDAGFRPGRFGWVVRLARRLVWPLVRPFDFYTLQFAEQTRDVVDQTQAALAQLRDDFRRLAAIEPPTSIDSVRLDMIDDRLLRIELRLDTLEPGIDGLRDRFDALPPPHPAPISHAEDVNRLVLMHARLRSEVLAIGNRHAWVEDRAAEALAKAQASQDALTPLGATCDEQAQRIEEIGASLAAASEEQRRLLDLLLANGKAAEQGLRALEADISAASSRLEAVSEQGPAFETRLAALADHIRTERGGLFMAAAQDGIFLLKAGELISEAVRQTGVWDAHITDAAALAVAAMRRRPGAPPHLLAVDVGAHFGLVTVAISHLFDRIICFEPNLFNVMLLRTNVLLNGLAATTEVRQQALASAAGTVSLAPSERQEIPLPLDEEGHFAPGRAGNLGAYSFVPDGTGLSAADALALDALQLDHLAFVKIDAQGGDGTVLMGAMETIARCRPWLVFEWEQLLSAQFGVGFDDVAERLRTMGYELSVLHRHNDKQVDYLAMPGEDILPATG